MPKKTQRRDDFEKMKNSDQFSTTEDDKTDWVDYQNGTYGLTLIALSTTLHYCPTMSPDFLSPLHRIDYASRKFCFLIYTLSVNLKPS